MLTDELPKTFQIVAYTGGKLHVDGFDLPVVVDLSGLEASGEIPIAIKHGTDDEAIIGQTDADQIQNDGRQLILGGIVTADADLSPKVKRIFTMAANGHKWQASIGARIEESYEVSAGETVNVNGQDQDGPFILATHSVLRETSVLAMGADKDTSVSFAAGAVINFKAESTTMDDDDFNKWVTDELGMDPATLTEKAKDALLQQYDAQTANDDEPLDAAGEGDDGDEGDDAKAAEGDEGCVDDKKGTAMAKANAKKPMLGTDGASATTLIASNRKLLAAEERRVAAIKKKCGNDSALIAKAIEKGWTVEKTENFYLKRKLESAPAGHVRHTSTDDQIRALQGGLLLRAGVKLDNAEFSGYWGRAFNLPPWLRAGVNADTRQKAMDDAWDHRELSLVDLCKMCVAMGPSRRAMSGWESHNDGSRIGFIRAAVAGGQLADIFTTNVNALLLQKFLEEPDTTVDWTREDDANNFQTLERTRMVKGPRLSKHARGGTADQATRADVMQSYKIARFSQTFSIDEMDMIDDHFGALKDAPDEMGLACARLRPDLVYAILLANGNINKEDGTSSALFSASQPNSQANYVSSGAALASGTLQTGMATMFNFLENKVPIQSNPTHLLIPAQLFGTAASLLQSPTIVIAGTAGSVTTQPTASQIAKMQEAWGLIKPVSDSRLANGVTDPNSGTTYAGSATQWYLASNKVPTIEVSYLKGSGRAPQVRQYILQQGQWGVAYDVNLDIGAKAMAWQGLYSGNA